MGPIGGRPSLLAPLRVPLAVLAACVVPAVAAGAVASGTGSFPAPVVAPVLLEEVPPELRVESLRVQVEGGEPAVVVRFAEGFEVPASGRYRVAVHLGEPDRSHVRSSFLSEDGSVTGPVEQGRGDDWQRQGSVTASQLGDRELAITVPSPPPAAGSSIWVEVSRDARGARRAVTPIYPFDDLLGANAARKVRTADVAWLQATGESQSPEPVEVLGPPELQVDRGNIIVTFPARPPARIGGIEVSHTVDVVRVAPDFTGQGAAPYLIAIDHDRGAISLLDGTQLIPAEVRSDEDWIVRDLPPRGVTAGGRVEMELDPVLRAFGVESTGSATALGIARSVTLEDGRIVRPDGVVATLDWFSGATAGAGSLPASTTTERATPGTGDQQERGETPGGSGDSPALAWVIVVSLAALATTATWLVWRWWSEGRGSGSRRPGAAHLARAIPRDGPTAPASSEESDELTERIFGR